MMIKEINLENRFRYDCSGKWFKGCLHIHTTCSDGRLSISEAASFYTRHGYDFIAITDHRIPFVESVSGEKWPLVMLDGIELDGADELNSYYHVICIGCVEGITTDMPLPEALEKARRQGSFLIWGHPHWSGNTVAEGLRYEFHGMEVYNHISEVSIGKGHGAFHWDSVLEQRPDMMGFATDDNHFFEGYPPQIGGWIMVNAHELSHEAILDAIHRGNFYSSNGPAFNSITIEKGNRVIAETSPILHARLIGPATKGKWKPAAINSNMTRIHFRIPEDWVFARLEIEDAFGKKAWSNPLINNK